MDSEKLAEFQEKLKEYPKEQQEFALRFFHRFEEFTSRPKQDDPEAARVRFRELIDIIADLKRDLGKEGEGLQELIDALQKVLDFYAPANLLKLVFYELGKKLDFESQIAQKMQEHFASLKMTDEERDELKYMQAFAQTQDAFGIIVRGHVLIENAIQGCIYSYVPKPADLYRKLEMYVSQKIQLAHMLGIIDESELDLLLEFNSLRNKIAHFGKGIANKGPSFRFSVEMEKQMWEKFTSAPAMQGAWPDYDGTKFPLHLRMMLMQLLWRLQRRSAELEKRKLAPIVESLQGDDVHVALQPLLSNWILIGFRGLESDPG